MKSRILIIGATSFIGKFIAQASAAQGHPTYALVRPATIAAKADVITSFKASGITIVEGSLEDYSSLLAAVKQADVVISSVNARQTLEQSTILTAIKEAGTVKRFLPSEFSNEVDRTHALDFIKRVADMKDKFRLAIQEANIPYTIVNCNSFARYFLSNLVQPGLQAPPRDKVTIHGDGNAKAVYVVEEDIATYTIKAVDDPRTLNKTLYMRPPANILSQNEVVALWEKKIGKKLQKTFVSEKEIIEQGKVHFYPAILHCIFVRGDQYNHDIGPNGVESTELYPEVKYTTADEFLQQFV